MFYHFYSKITRFNYIGYTNMLSYHIITSILSILILLKIRIGCYWPYSSWFCVRYLFQLGHED